MKIGDSYDSLSMSKYVSFVSQIQIRGGASGDAQSPQGEVSYKFLIKIQKAPKLIERIF